MATDKLKASADYGQLAGFRNMLSKENARWWNIKSLAFQLVLWLIVLNALVFFVLFFVPPMVNSLDNNQTSHLNTEENQSLSRYSSPHEVANIGMATFFQLAGFAAFIGAVIFGHDAILKERESGTAAWLLSKPLSRKAFVLAKLCALLIGVLGIILLAQGAVAYAMCSAEQGSPMPVLPFLEGLCVLGLGILFYLVLAFALGAFTMSRGVTLGVPLVIGIVGGLILSVLQAIDQLTQVSYLVPWNLTSYGSALATGDVLDQYWPWPVLATAVLVLAFVWAVVARFDRIEL